MRTCVQCIDFCAQIPSLSRCGRTPLWQDEGSVTLTWLRQEDLVWLEAKDDQDAVETEEFYAGGGQVARRGLEHFPQLWCPPGRYSVYGQARAPLCCAMSARACGYLRASGLVCLPLCVYRPCMNIGLSSRATATGLSSETTAWSRAMLGCRCRWPHARERRGRQLFFTPLSQALRLVIHLGEPLPPDALDRFSTDARALLLFFGLPYALMMWTNGVGASTGMFVPALAVGATGARPPRRASRCTGAAHDGRVVRSALAVGATGAQHLLGLHTALPI